MTRQRGEIIHLLAELMEANIDSAKLSSCALTDWQVTLDVAEKTASFSAAEILQVREFLADPPGWSRSNGGTN